MHIWYIVFFLVITLKRTNAVYCCPTVTAVLVTDVITTIKVCDGVLNEMLLTIPFGETSWWNVESHPVAVTTSTVHKILN